MGVSIPKVYKKDNKLVIIVPGDVISRLGVKEGDDVDFLPYNDKAFVFAKKSDLLNILTGSKQMVPAPGRADKAEVSGEELSVLKKLDTLRYNERTKESVQRILDGDENAVLQALLKRKVVTLFKKEGDKEPRYSIPRDIYDRFLYGKRDAATSKAAPQKAAPAQYKARGWEVRLKEQNKYADMLEAKGYLVLPSEAEATAMSTLLEESIRLGLVVGTRAFNKKFYVALKAFVTENAVPILELIEKKSMPIADISKSLGMDEDAARTILCLLAESGDVTEVRRDIFRAA